MPVELTPDQYRCDEHGEDLGERVRDELAAEVPVTFNRRAPRPFRVLVECPGGGRPHEVACTGEVRYRR